MLQVESAIVRLAPHNPPSMVQFEEFDGLTRVVFSRPHKTVHGNLVAKGVFKMLDSNYRTWCSRHETVRAHIT